MAGALFAKPARSALVLVAGLGIGGAGVALQAVPSLPAGATSSHAKTVTVTTATVPHIGTVLATGTGLTLYRYSEDAAGGSTCTGACAKIWPPLLAPKGSHIKGPKGVKGLSLIKVGNGHWQVAFHKVALYRFAGDKKKGQAKGQSVEGEWFAVLKSGVPAAATESNAGTSSTTTPTSAPTSTTQPMTSTTQGSNVATPTGPPASHTPATQSTSPPPTNPPTTSPPPTTTPPTTPPTSPPTTPMGGGGYGY